MAHRPPSAALVCTVRLGPSPQLSDGLLFRPRLSTLATMDDHGLKQKIIDAPDDREAYAVYADFLLQHGDPRGELIQLDLALEDDSRPSAERNALRAKRDAVLSAHARTWLGPLSVFLLETPRSDKRRRWEYRHRFERGFLHTVEAEEPSSDFCDALVETPERPHLKRLLVNATNYDDEDALGRLGEGVFENLRHFRLGGGDTECHTNGEYATDAIVGMSRIEELLLYAHRVDTERLFERPMPHLRRLAVHHVYEYPVSVLAANPTLGGLEMLSFHPHALEPGDEEAYLRLEDMEALTESEHLHGLKHLEFRLCSMGDEGIELLCTSPLLAQLEVLDLSYGRVTDAGADMLASAEGTRTLRRLVLDGNRLTEAGIGQLEGLELHELSVSEQFDEDDDDDYQEYLTHGDIE